MRWVERAGRGRWDFDDETLADLRTRIEACDEAGGTTARQRAVVRAALLDTLAFELDRPRRMPRDFAERAARVARRALAEELGYESRRGELLEWLTRDVLALEGVHPPARRRAALELLAGRYEPTTMLALLSVTDDPEGPLYWPGLGALVGWNEEAVHRRLVSAVRNATPEAESRAWELLELHLLELDAPLAGRAADALLALVSPALVAEDWRTAVRAARLVPALPSSHAVPAVLEALAAWQTRAAADAPALGPGPGSLRVEHALVDDLRRRSGRSLGLDVERWRTWWERVESGEVRLAREEDRPPTQATFFGLRLGSDRVVFIIDRSRSMERPFDYRTERSRWEEARSQLASALAAAGERTRFGLVTFHEEADRWRSRLVPATPEMRRDAERWLAGREPGGKTRIAQGLDEALDLRSNRPLDPRRVDVDTVVILCDGATAEDEKWAARWLRRHNREAELVFHCVQIGRVSSGALEHLATGSGGRFVRVSAAER